MKRLFSLLLLAALLVGTLSLFVACKDPASPEGGGSGTPDVEYLDGLDGYGDSLDFSAQKEFVISYADHFKHEVYGEEGSSDKLDTLIYDRNRLLESRFGLKISTEYSVHDTAGKAHYEYVLLHLNTGDVSFDVASMNAYQAGKIVLGSASGVLDFRSEVPYVRDSIKAEKEWWPSEINVDSTVMGRQFVAVSDFSLSAIEMCLAVIFNRDLAKSTNVVSKVNSLIGQEKYTGDATLYDVVRGNDWTLDVMTGIVKDYWRDNPAVGVRGDRDANDRFGLLAPLWTDIDAFAYAFGCNYIINNGVAAPSLWDWDGDQYDMIEDLRELYYCKGTWTDDSLRHLYDRAGFFAQTDRVLFMLNTLGSLKCEQIHEMVQNFGVLPYPKYTRGQADYLSGSIDNYSALVVPFILLWDQERLRMTGALLEALSAENCKSVKGVYYDEIVTHHNVTDGDSAEMIDIIMAGRVYDLGVYHHNELVMDPDDTETGSFALFFRHLVRNPYKDIVQYWQSNRGPLELQLDSLLERYNSIGTG